MIITYEVRGRRNGSIQMCHLQSAYPILFNCSKWGHGPRTRSRDMPGCRYCAGAHETSLYAVKIAEGKTISRKCVHTSRKTGKTNLKKQEIRPPQNMASFPHPKDEAEFQRQPGRANVATQNASPHFGNALQQPGRKTMALSLSLLLEREREKEEQAGEYLRSITPLIRLYLITPRRL